MNAPALTANHRVLVIDDNQAIHEDFRKILGNSLHDHELLTARAALFDDAAAEALPAGFEVDCADQGQAGLALVEAARAAGRPYALAFVDMRMPPGWDGVETVERLWRVDPQLQVVICTAYSDHAWDEVTRRLGATDRLLILRKPFDNIEVWQLAVAITRKWHLARQTERDARELEAQVQARTSQLSEANERLLTEMAARQQEAAERLRMERKLLQGQKLESLGLVAGGIAHDFNNLLTSIMGNANLARTEAGPDTPLWSFFEQIEMSCQRAAALCNQLLAYAGKGRFTEQMLDLGLVIDETLPMLRTSLGQHGRIVCQAEHGLRPVSADLPQMQQLIMNLVINAAEALEDRTGEVRISLACVEASTAMLQQTLGAPELPAGSYLRLCVADTGCGMSPEILAKSFDPFFTTKFLGRGLGLAAVFGIVRRHRGAIRAESQAGCGSTFEVFLPCVDVSQAREVHPPAVAGSWHGSGEVLVVDDQEEVRKVIAAMLKTMGFKPVMASGGLEGLALMREHADTIVAVLLDLTMPGMDGEEAFLEMRKIRPNTPVVLISGYSENHARAVFRAEGLAGFLQKPFHPQRLREVLHSLVGNPDRSPA